MSPTSMPPPPSPLAHRRTRINSNFNTIESSSCVPHKMSLLKGATFHSSSSPASEVDPVLSVQYLSRRSPTCSHASLSSLLSEKRGLAAHAIADFEETFSGARGSNHTSRRRSAETFNQQLKEVRAALPTDEGLGSSISSPSEKGLSKSLAQVELDSGLGESVDGSVIVDGTFVQHNIEKDSSVAANLIQDTDSSEFQHTQIRQQGRGLRLRTTAPRVRTQNSHIDSTQSPQHPALSRFAKKKISELLFTPLLKEDRFKPLRHFVTHLGSKVNKNIRCLRDLEKSLIFQPVVSVLYPPNRPGSNKSSKTQVPTLTPRLYRSFGEYTIQLVIDTYNHLSESEQRRSTDRPYSSGYFLDLVEQVNQLAAHIRDSTTARELGEDADTETYSIEDEVTLEGGLGSTGDFAELVRWKDGQGISLRTGLPYEPFAGLKRQHSTMTDEEIARSMARRKKGYIPEIVEMKCSDPECDKIFTRKCDLAKHEKTHSRPFKCAVKTCKYHELGLPTEKERDRHMNDKHDPNPKLYKCNYCEFKTKRESNCKQHMEKKHDWEYKRAKGKDKDSGSTPSQTPLTQAVPYSPAVVQPSPALSIHHGWDDHSSVSGGSIMESNHGFTPVDLPVNEFTSFNPGYASMPLFPRTQPPPGTQYIQTSPHFGFEMQNQNFGYDQFGSYVSPVKTTPDAVKISRTPITPAYSTFTPPSQSPYGDSLTYGHGTIINQGFNPQDGLPTPESATYPYSRHASVQYDSPHHLDQQMNDDFLGGHDIQLPQGDFALNFNAFSNPAAADQVLFDEKAMSQQFDVNVFNNTNFDNIDDFEMDGMDEYVNFNGN